jgi:hypothetical protein
LDGACHQFLSRSLFRAAADFQKRDYTEHQDRRSNNAEQSPTEVLHWQITKFEMSPLRL